MTDVNTGAATAAALAAALLVATLLAVLTLARYETLRQEAKAACTTAAALDLSAFTRLCTDVGYR